MTGTRYLSQLPSHVVGFTRTGQTEKTVMIIDFKTVILSALLLMCLGAGAQEEDKGGHLVKKSRANAEKEYRKKLSGQKRGFRIIDHSNIAGTKAILAGIGRITGDNLFINSYGMYVSKVNHSKGIWYYGGRYMVREDETIRAKWYLAEGGYQPFVATFLYALDFRLDLGTGMGMVAKDDFRTGQESSSYCVGFRGGGIIVLKLNTWLHLYGNMSIYSIYDTNRVDSNVLYNTGLRLMINN